MFQTAHGWICLILFGGYMARAVAWPAIAKNCYWLDIGRMDDYATAQEQYAANAGMFLGGNV